MEKILFIDIETVSQKKYFEDLDEGWKDLWIKKSHHINAFTENPEESYHNRAAIFAEFGKIICISIGTLSSKSDNSNNKNFVLKSVFGKDEKLLLENFCQLLDNYEKKFGQFVFAGHNIVEFDIPFLCRRMLVHEILIPSYLNFQNKKPWEITIHDTLKLWKFGDYKNFTSLNLLTKLLNIPSPKYDLDGSKIGNAFYHDNDLHRIVHYCEEDVIAVARLFYKMTYFKSAENWEIVRQTTFDK